MSAVTTLSPLSLPGHQPSAPNSDDEHPMRVMTRRAAGLQDPPWDSGAAEQVAGLFDSLAPQWHTRESTDRAQIVGDALARGLDVLRSPGVPGVALELGSGLGTYSAMIAERFATTVAVEISEEMHRRAHRSDALRMIGDGSMLPVQDSSVGALVLINCFLFPAEVARILAPEGVLVWVNTSGESTPIHLPTREVTDALEFEVEGLEARAGSGTWSALRRLS